MTLMLETIGATMLHFLWQGTLVAVATAIALHGLRRGGAHLRYLVASASLAVMLGIALVTAWTVSGATGGVAGSPRQMVEASGDTEPVTWHRHARQAPTRRVRGDPAYGFVAAIVDIVTQARAVAPAPPPLRSGLGLLWLTGVVLLLGRLGTGWHRLRRLRTDALRTAPSMWQARANAIATRLGIHRRVRVVDRPEATLPSMSGWMHPIVILPIAALAHLTPAQVEAILTHELAHIRRHDFLVNVLQRVVETLLFFHPAVWWISNRMRIEREYCCDDLVVEAGVDRAEYSTALLRLAQRNDGVPALALSAIPGPLLNRVRRLLRVPTKETMTPEFVTCVTLVGCVLVGMCWAGSHAVPPVAHAAERVPVDMTHLRSADSQSPWMLPAPTPGARSALPVADPPTKSDAAGVVDDARPAALPVTGALAKQADSVEWQRLESPEFEVLFERGLTSSRAGDVLASARAAADSARERFGVRLPFRPTLMLIATSARLQQLQGSLSPGRILLPLDETPETLKRVLWYELGHLFLLEMARTGPAAATGNDSGLPIWLVEGFADHFVDVWRPVDSSMLREFLRDGGDTRMSRYASAAAANPRLTNALGHAAVDFIDSRFGSAALKQLIAGCAAPNASTAARPPLAVDDVGLVCPSVVFTNALGLTPDRFDGVFGAYLKTWLNVPPQNMFTQGGVSIFSPGSAGGAITDGRSVVLVFDRSTLSPQLLARATEESVRWLDTPPAAPNRVAVVILEPQLRILADFSASRGDLDAALQVARAGAAGAAPAAGGPAAVVDSQAEAPLRSLTTLCETLAAIPGRKMMLFFTAGLSGRLGTEASLRLMTNACNKANVTVNPVDAQGLRR